MSTGSHPWTGQWQKKSKDDEIQANTEAAEKMRLKGK